MSQAPLGVDLLSDEDGGAYAVHVHEAAHVRLTAPLRYLLAGCRADHRVPVLVTGANAVLSPYVVSAMRISGGTWAVQTDDGVYDGLRGCLLNDFIDLSRPASTEQHPAYTNAPPPEVDEPLTFARDDRRTTDSLRAQMPTSEPHLFGCPDGSFAAVSVARTKHGLLERVRGGVPAGRWCDRDLPQLAAAAAAALTGLAASHQVLAGYTSVAPTADLSLARCQRPGLRPAEDPLAIVLGPRAVHDLQPDLAGLRAHVDVTALGRPRLPALLLQVRDGNGWEQLAGAFDTVGVDRTAAALGLDGELLERLFGPFQDG